MQNDADDIGGYKIGSFNVLNLKTDVANKSSQAKEDFKRLRIAKIAELIMKQEFAIIALQEIQSRETVKQIVLELNKSSACWDFVHCDRAYKDLNTYSLPGRKMLEDRAELAFIFDMRKVKFVKDYVFYKGIHEQFLTAMQYFITTLLGIVAVGMGIAAEVDDADKDEAELRKSKKGNHHKAVLGTGAAASGIAAIGSWFGMEHIKAKTRKQIEDFLSRTLRPPLVALFKPVDSERNVQLRFINMHSQFSFDNAPDKARQKALQEARQAESQFVLERIFHIVNTQRVLSLSNLNSTTFTIAAGDFNLTKKQLDKVIKRRSVKEVEPNLAVLQNHPSTITCVNKEKVTSGEDTEYCYSFTDNDYDHFILDGGLWGIDSEPKMTKCLGEGVVEDFDILRPKHKANPHRQAISDHHPIAICSNAI